MKPQETSLKPLQDTLNGEASDGSDAAKLVGGRKHLFIKNLLQLCQLYLNKARGEIKSHNLFFFKANDSNLCTIDLALDIIHIIN